jgi:pseudouridine-5'-monophosphatase
MSFNKVTHVIWDFDGVLIDSEQVYSNVNQRMLSKYGKEFTLEIKTAMMGTKKTEAVKILLQKAEIDHLITPDQYMTDYDILLEESLTECAELPGGAMLIDYFYKNKIPMAICTGSDTREFELKTSKLYKHWLEKIPLQILCGDDPEVTHGKPSPIPYQVAIKRIANGSLVRPEHVLVFEDSLNG